MQSSARKKFANIEKRQRKRKQLPLTGKRQKEKVSACQTSIQETTENFEAFASKSRLEMMHVM
jgi:hypothetical protein